MHIKIDLLEDFLQLFILFQKLEDVLHQGSICIPRKTRLGFCFEAWRILLHLQLVGVAPAQEHVNVPLAGFFALVRLVDVPCYILGAAASALVMRCDLLLFFRSVLEQIEIDPDLRKVLVVQQLHLTSVSSAPKLWRQDVGRNQVLCLVVMVGHLHLFLSAFICDHWLFKHHIHFFKSFHFLSN